VASPVTIALSLLKAVFFGEFWHSRDADSQHFLLSRGGSIILKDGLPDYLLAIIRAERQLILASLRLNDVLIVSPFRGEPGDHSNIAEKIPQVNSWVRPLQGSSRFFRQGAAMI
jgi:hypothetical protein